jgi:hypothetical protein
MKTTHEMSTVDRISTHEELHQVLALLSDPADRVANEASTEPEEDNLFRDAVSNLWQDRADDEADAGPETDASRWAEFADRSERVN